MWCPKCADENTKVIGTVLICGKIERFRVCQFCNFSFVTIETNKNKSKKTRSKDG